MNDQTPNPDQPRDDETMPATGPTGDGRFRRFLDRSITLWSAALAMLAVLIVGGLSGAAIHAAAADEGHGDRHGQIQRGERDGRGGEFRDDRMPPPPAGEPAPGGVPGTPPSTPPTKSPTPEGSTESPGGDAT